MSYFELYEKRKQLKPGSVWVDTEYPDQHFVIIEKFFDTYSNRPIIKYRTLNDHHVYTCPMNVFLNITTKLRDFV